MPVSSSAAWVKEMRRRKEWSRDRFLLELGEEYNLSIVRIERGEQQPRPGTMQSLGHITSMPVYDFICPTLENRPAPLKHQYSISQEVQSLFSQGAPPETLYPLIQKGIAQTLKKYDEENLHDVLLIYEEPTLFHFLAKTHLRAGNVSAATRILQGIRESFNKLPIDDIERDTTLAPILLTLSDCLMQEGEYIQAVRMCNEGLHVSASRNHGTYTPAFLYKKAVCLRLLGKMKSARKFYRLAYFGYELLHKRKEAQGILDEVQAYGLSFETYGVEKLEYTPQPPQACKQREIPHCDNISQLIKIVRIQEGLKQRDLYQGLCSKANYSKIEGNQIEKNHYLLEPIMQRLGLDINLYCRFYLGAKNFHIHQQRERMHQLLIKRKYSEAEKILTELESHEDYQHGYNLQFIQTAKATFYRIRYGETPTYLQMLYDAITITWPDFNEEDLGTRRITLYEANLVNQIANYFTLVKDYTHAEKIYNQLINKINTQYRDDVEKTRSYATVLYNYGRCLYDMESYNKSMGVIEDGINFEIKNERLFMLPDFMYYWASNLIEANRKKESVPYYALTYYGSIIFANYGKSPFVPIISDYTKEHFDITFE
jgi:transcriptional regulator with XRE-family HTH domain